MQAIKKTLTLLTLLTLIVSCAKKNNPETILLEHKKTKRLAYTEQKNNSSHLNQKIERNDTVFSKESPIKIISCRLQKNQYSDHMDFHIRYKNVSGKTIQAIRFEWNCKNAFDKPSSGKLFFEKGRSEGYCTRTLKPGASNYKVWEDFSTDASSITFSRAYYVVFTDGKKWKFKD